MGRRGVQKNIKDFKTKTLREMDRNDVVNALSTYIYNCIEKQEKLRKSKITPSIFNEHDLYLTPSFDDIRVFLKTIFERRRLQTESGVVALIYLIRTRHRITSYNWKRLVLVSFILANKDAEDVYSVYNVRFVDFIPNLPVYEINVLEVEFLQLLNYRLHIETKEYENYYRKLQLLNLERLEETSNEDDDPHTSPEENLVEPEEEDVEQGQLEKSPIFGNEHPLNKNSSLMCVAKPLKPSIPIPVDLEKLSCADSFA